MDINALQRLAEGAEEADDDAPVHRFRTIFISDIHLGTRACQAERLLDFLKQTDCETLFLVGDIVDGWRLRRSWHWPQAHNDVVQKLLRKGRKGTKIHYIPGNHDEFARAFLGHEFGIVSVADDMVHETADGRRLLVIHGDQFDIVVRRAKWLAHLGDWAYVALLNLNTFVNALRRRLGLGYWSLSAYLKHKTKKAVDFIGRFEATLIAEARRRGLDGVVCGHIHTAETRTVDGLVYCNDGDWVESCTALVEHHDGRLELIRWGDRSRQAEEQAEAAEIAAESRVAA
ncbi:MAG: UDP-2,3-diacylglucosamine diphosphatase [Azospirillaceae bacterium]